MIKEVLDIMNELARERMTMLVATHEMGLAREVGHGMVFMDQGRILEVLSPEELFTRARWSGRSCS
jgi:ABC-type polar amino acid transport system ATPase subunit